jgi:FAD/FMN-containing dehydrogenase
MSAGSLFKGFPKSVELCVDASALASFATDVSGKRGAPPMGSAAVRTTDDISAVIRWAAAQSVPVVPVSSTGGPRRRGDTVCPRPALILDLSGMKRIIHVDGRDAIAVIEPGVTFAELDQALAPHGLRSFRPLVTRGGKSVLAAFLEREPMTVPGQHWDSADPLSAFEVVFGTGDVFRTGGAALSGSLEELLARGNRQMIGTGPTHTDFGRVIQGAQGSLGVVSWASIYCQRQPAVEMPLFASSDRLEAVVDLVYRMVRHRSSGQMFVLNARHLAHLVEGSADAATALAARLPRWIAYIELSAAEHFAQEAIAYRQADLKRDAAELAVKVTGELAGIGAAAFRRHCQAAPDTGGADDIVFLTQMDKVGGHLSALEAAGETDVAVYIQPLAQGANAHCQISLASQPDGASPISGRTIRAAEIVADSGGFFSRPYHPWAHVPFDRDTTIKPLLQRTKQVFDPNGILQPQSQSLGGI